jgi:hypothetical protein
VGPNQNWEVEEVELDAAKPAGVLVKLTARGRHSDHHLVTGDLPVPFLCGAGAETRREARPRGDDRDATPHRLALYRAGPLKPDKLITREYPPEDINQG